MTLEARVSALEALLHAVPSNIPASELTPPLARVREALCRLPGAALFRVPANYYALDLRSRARLLCCSPHQLCKTLIFENPAAAASSSTAAGRSAPPPALGARYVAVVLQYTHKLDLGALQRLLGAPGLALAADGAQLSGFAHNGVSPFGMAGGGMPVLWCKSVLALGGAVWVGGGEPDVKARVFVGALRGAGLAPAAVLDVSLPRGEEEWEA